MTHTPKTSLMLLVSALLLPAVPLMAAQAEKIEELDTAQADYETGFTEKNVKRQFQATQFAAGLLTGIKTGDRGRVFQALQHLRQIDQVTVSNPRKVFETLLESLTHKDLRWEDYGLQREIARQTRRFAHSVYLVARKHKKVVTEKEKKELLDKLDKVLDQLDEGTAPGNGLRFELQVARAVVDVLPDTTNKWEKLADVAMNLYDTVNDYDVEAAGKLLQACVKAVAKQYNKQWYEVVLLLDHLKHTAAKDEKDFKQLQDILYAYKQKRMDKQALNMMNDCRGDWRVLFAGVEALGYVAAHTSNTKLREAALHGMHKTKPGLAYYLGFDKFKLRNNWRIRQKAAEELVLLTQHEDDELAEAAEKYLLRRRQGEKDKRARRILEQPEILTAVREALGKKWDVAEKVTVKRFNEMLKSHGKQLRKALGRTLKAQLDSHEEHLREQGELLRQLREAQEVKQPKQMVKLLDAMREQLQTALTERIGQLEDKLETQAAARPSDDEDDSKEAKEEKEDEQQKVAANETLKKALKAAQKLHEALQQTDKQLASNAKQTQTLLRQELVAQTGELKDRLEGLRRTAEELNVAAKFVPELQEALSDLSDKLDTMDADNKDLHRLTQKKLVELSNEMKSLSSSPSKKSADLPTLEQRALSPSSQVSDLGGKNVHVKKSVKKKLTIKDSDKDYDTNLSTKQTAEDGGQAALRGGKNIIIDGDVEELEL